MLDYQFFYDSKKNLNCLGFDINKKRIPRKKKDTNKEYLSFE